MKATFFKALVIHHISAMFPVKDFHDLARLPYKDIDITIARIEAYTSNLTTQTIYSHAHIRRVLRHDKSVTFIQIEHRVFERKVRNQKSYMKVGIFRTDT